jgi:hypothetical protein
VRALGALERVEAGAEVDVALEPLDADRHHPDEREPDAGDEQDPQAGIERPRRQARRCTPARG